jgi:hypothetical protein
LSTEETIMKTRWFKRMVATLGLLALGFGKVAGESSMATTRFTLVGESAGGVMVVTPLPAAGGTYAKFVVTNAPGDSAAVVLRRLARELALNHHGGELAGAGTDAGECLLLPGGYSLPVEGKRLQSPYWVVGGNDGGCGIPPAPVFLTCTWETNLVTLRWCNEAVYDSIWVLGGSVRSTPLAVLSGSADRCVLDGGRLAAAGLRGGPARELTVAVVGMKNGVPSTAAALRLSDGKRQECLSNLPFAHGVMPGFRFWSQSAAGQRVSRSQAIQPPETAPNDSRLHRLRFGQIIQSDAGFEAGLYRRWLGLTPGGDYRLSLQTGKASATVSGVVVTAHAVPLRATAGDLTAAQMAGDDLLPNGTRDLQAIELAAWSVARRADVPETGAPVGLVAPPVQGRTFRLAAEEDSIACWIWVASTEAAEIMLMLESLALEKIEAN